MEDREILGHLLAALSEGGSADLYEFGIKIGKLYSDRGFPIDMALDLTPDLSYNQKLVVIHGSLTWLLQHRRNSGSSEKTLARIRKTNRAALGRFAETGEVGLY